MAALMRFVAPAPADTILAPLSVWQVGCLVQLSFTLRWRSWCSYEFGRWAARILLLRFIVFSWKPLILFSFSIGRFAMMAQAV